MLELASRARSLSFMVLGAVLVSVWDAPHPLTFILFWRKRQELLWSAPSPVPLRR